ncbi:MAG: hypothetical protein HeimC2_44630 [Candidatus Heimdallarchaeota archaeon LC_2]|nr:MAG: hypothetical protein HeimC2_44630 [Candidatus Heimdallarchaeota archaeon LC_2]
MNNTLDLALKIQFCYMLTIRNSISEDIQELKDTLLESFVQASIDDFGNKTSLPPGVSDGSQIDNALEKKTTFTILWDSKIVGGIIIELKESKEHYLQTIWVMTKFQNKGIGKNAIAFLEDKFPDAKSWVLETPSVAKRNRRFYEKLGYKVIGEQRFDNSPVILINYKKEMSS